MPNQTFFILKPDGRWICPRSFDGHHTCTDAGNGKDIVKLAGFVSSVVNYTKSSSTTLVTPPSKKDAIGEYQNACRKTGSKNAFPGHIRYFCSTDLVDG